MSKKDNYFSGIASGISSKKSIHHASKQISTYGEAGSNLSSLNTMRGDTMGFKGFVGENLEAAEATARGRRTLVLNDNRIADLKHLKTNGTESLKQLKIGYKPGQIDFSRYKGQTVVIDKGNPNFHIFCSISHYCLITRPLHSYRQYPLLTSPSHSGSASVISNQWAKTYPRT